MGVIGPEEPLPSSQLSRQPAAPGCGGGGEGRKGGAGGGGGAGAAAHRPPSQVVVMQLLGCVPDTAPPARDAQC